MDVSQRSVASEVGTGICESEGLGSSILGRDIQLSLRHGFEVNDGGRGVQLPRR